MLSRSVLAGQIVTSCTFLNFYRQTNMLDPELRKVRMESMIPRSHRTPLGLQKSMDFYLQRFIKAPYVCEFHCYPELLHAALLESDSSISQFVPQPFKLRLNKRFYIPDSWYLEHGKPCVVEIKSDRGVEQFETMFWTEFFKSKGIHFKIIPNSTVLDKELKARNWLMLVKLLLEANDENVELEEYALLDLLTEQGTIALGHWIDPGARGHSRAKEIAMARLAHRGQIKINCDTELIHWETQLCFP